jgi:hypothetical protein
MALPKLEEVKRSWMSSISVVFALLLALTVGMALAIKYVFESLSL